MQESCTKTMEKKIEQKKQNIKLKSQTHQKISSRTLSKLTPLKTDLYYYQFNKKCNFWYHQVQSMVKRNDIVYWS